MAFLWQLYLSHGSFTNLTVCWGCLALPSKGLGACTHVMTSLLGTEK